MHVVHEVTPETGRILSTVLFIDIVDSTRRAAELGDRNWREALADYQVAVRKQLQRFSGHEVDWVGDGFLAEFDGTARSIRCAMAVRDEVRPLGLEIRCGIHAGEVERSAGELVGIAVHTGSRIAALAALGEILVSALVRDLVAGSGIRFDERGEHSPKGIPGRWQLFAART